jgi:hypothetical protein
MHYLIIPSQVNPVMNWFIPQPTPRYPETEPAGSLFRGAAKGVQFLKDEAQHQGLVLLRALRLLIPGQDHHYGGLVQKFFGQKWHGHVTIQPPFNLLDYFQVFGNPEARGPLPPGPEP